MNLNTGLVIPSNIGFHLWPPHSPKLNPTELRWALLKGRLANQLWFDLDELRQALSHQLRQLTRYILRSLMLR